MNPKRNQELARKNQRKHQGCVDATGEVRGGPCEICGKVYKTLDYDHDHKTGLHRGWLCRWCNLKLGWLEKWRVEIEMYLLEGIMTEKEARRLRFFARRAYRKHEISKAVLDAILRFAAVKQ